MNAGVGYLSLSMCQAICERNSTGSNRTTLHIPMRLFWFLIGIICLPNQSYDPFGIKEVVRQRRNMLSSFIIHYNEIVSDLFNFRNFKNIRIKYVKIYTSLLRRPRSVCSFVVVFATFHGYTSADYYSTAFKSQIFSQHYWFF